MIFRMTENNQSPGEINQLLHKYLKQTGRLRTLNVLEEEWNCKKLKKCQQKNKFKSSVKLSFNILKAPVINKHLELALHEKKRRKKKTKSNEKGI